MKRSERVLSEIELRGSADVAEYSTALRDTLRQMAQELDLTASELATVLEHSTGGAVDRAVARHKARRVARRLRRARDLIDAAATEGARLWSDYATEYGDLISPTGKKAGWKWEA